MGRTHLRAPPVNSWARARAQPTFLVPAVVATSRNAVAEHTRAQPTASLLSPAVLATSTNAVAELAASATLGYAAVTTGLIEKVAITQLARIVYNFLLPIFLFTSVLTTVTTYGISRGMLALPLVSAIQISCGLAVASLVLRAVGISPKLRSSRRFMSCVAFGNSGVLPLVLTEALFRAPYPNAAILPRAASYLSFYLLGWSPIFWSLGKVVLLGNEGTADSQPRWKVLAGRILSPPIIGALTGLAVGLVCPSWALDSPRSPLRVVLQAMRNLARAYPPTALLVLAGSLAGGTAAKGVAARATAAADQPAAAVAAAPAPLEAPVQAEREMSTLAMVLYISACRFVLSPLIACGLVHLLHGLRVLPAVSADPVLTFMLLLNSAMPPAQNSVLILQVANDQQGATQMSRILFVMYALAAVPISVLLSIFLQRVGL